MAHRNAAFDARHPALPIGFLGDETLRNIVLAGLVHFRTGPWVALRDDGSRVVRIEDGSEPPLFAGQPPRPPAEHASEVKEAPELHVAPEPPLFAGQPLQPAQPSAHCDDGPALAPMQPSRTVVLARPARARRATRPHGHRARPRRR